MPSKLTRHFGITPGQRFSTGLIASVRCANGERRSQHFVGATLAALTDMAEWCDGIGAKVIAISTPQTIYRDLLGSRRTLTDRNASQRISSYAEHTTDKIDTPEAAMLGRIGRKDLPDV